VHFADTNDLGWTGNEGHPVEYWYRVTVFVLTSMDKHLQYLAKTNPRKACDEMFSRYHFFTFLSGFE
jgi:hypothetical protein